MPVSGSAPASQVSPTLPIDLVIDRHDDLDPRVAIGTWHYLDVLVEKPHTPNIPRLLVYLLPERAFGVREIKKRNGVVVRIALKSVARRLRVRDILGVPNDSGVPPNPSMIDVNMIQGDGHAGYKWAIDPKYWETVMAYHNGPSDLHDLVLRAPGMPGFDLPPSHRLHDRAKENQWYSDRLALAPRKEKKTTWRFLFLDEPNNPWRVANTSPTQQLPSREDRLRFLHVVEFPRDWLFDRFTGAECTPELRRLEMIMRMHVDVPSNQRVRKFYVLMWPTDGPYDAIIRKIARQAATEFYGSDNHVPKTSVKRMNENFGYEPESGMWRIELELGLEQARYLHDPMEPIQGQLK